MADAPQVKKLYTRLALLLSLGLVAGLAIWLTQEPGAGSINVAGATVGVGLAAVAYTFVLAMCLYFMGRVSTVIAASGGPVSTQRYQTLGLLLFLGVAIGAVILFAASPNLTGPEIGSLLVGSSIVLGTLTLVMVAFLGFLRSLVAHSDMNDSSVLKLYATLIAVGIVGVAAGAFVVSSYTPGAGPFNVAAVALAIGFTTLVLAGVTLGLLIYLSSTVRDVVQAANNPASGSPVSVSPEKGAQSDPKVTYSALSERIAGRDVIDVEGIGEEYQTRLKENLGITTFGQLFAADAARVAKSIDTTSAQVRQWQQMIHLMDIKGIGPQYSEILVMAGVTTPKQLATANQAELLATIDAIEARRKSQRVIGVNVEGGMVKRFVQLAKEHEKM